MAVYGSYLSGVILAGGQNKRFPILKGFIKINNTTIIEKNLILLNTLFEEVFISANDIHPYLRFATTVITDLIPPQGPMTGIYSCLLKSKANSIFVLTCDMPFVEETLVRYFCDYFLRILDSNVPYDAVIPRCFGKVEPLFAIYSKSALPSMKKSIELKKVKMRQFLEKINTHYVDLSNIIDETMSWRLSFENINTLSDFERLKGKGLNLNN
ncbi:MAG TPA: molybdenum cofactor guanylyltransferase [Nitrospirae bacterium]|nr:molybdenum cofactor guanylyltransferase [Nitrospirota bacterium]